MHLPEELECLSEIVRRLIEARRPIPAQWQALSMCIQHWVLETHIHGGAAGPGPCMRPPPAPSPPRVLKDSGAGSATNKCP